MGSSELKGLLGKPWHIRRDNIKMEEEVCEFDWYGSKCKSMINFCESEVRLSGCVKCREFFLLSVKLLVILAKQFLAIIWSSVVKLVNLILLIYNGFRRVARMLPTLLHLKSARLFACRSSRHFCRILMEYDVKFYNNFGFG